MSSQRNIAEKFQLPKRLAGSEQTVWNQYGALIEKYEPLNFTAGFTDSPVPEYMTAALAKVADGSNPSFSQYARGFGHMRLVEALATLYSKLINRKIDPSNEVLITTGAYGALFNTLLGHVDEGDEVIVIEPYFDSYVPIIKMAGGVPRFVQLRPRSSIADGVISSGDWVLDDDELAAAFNQKTKAIVLNTPLNPLGKVFNRSELTKIADLCKKHNVLCISDEVYEWLVYDDNEHVRMCTLPDMWERTITIGSAGKTFSLTGWKTGWAYGPNNLIVNLQMVHQNSIDCCPTPIQEALAIIFETELNRLGSADCYFTTLPLQLKAKRDYVVNFLKNIGMNAVVPQGAYFIMVDWSRYESKVDLSREPDQHKDVRFTKWMIKNVGLSAIPPSAFYNDEHKSSVGNYIRFCFYKKDERLQKAAEILRNFAEQRAIDE